MLKRTNNRHRLYSARQHCACLLAALCLPFFSSSALSAVTLAECGGLIRPNIESYDDYNSFMVEIISYKKKHRSCKKIMAAAAKKNQAPRPNEEKLIISNDTGLENISRAVQNAKNFPHPNYSQPLRFNRTTAQSFSLPKVRTLDMGDHYIVGALEETAADGTTRTMSEKELRETEFANNTIAVDFNLDGIDADNLNAHGMLSKDRVGVSLTGRPNSPGACPELNNSCASSISNGAPILNDYMKTFIEPPQARNQTGYVTEIIGYTVISAEFKID